MKHLLTFWYVLSVIFPKILTSGKRPVIFSRWSGIGDIIGTMPSVLELAKRHKGCPLIYNCYNEFSSLPRLAGLECTPTSFPEIGLVGHWYRFLLSGFYHLTADDDDLSVPPKHNFIKEFGARYSLNIKENHPTLMPSKKNIERMQKLVEKALPDNKQMVIIHPGPTVPVREWPVENWNQLVIKLNERGYNSIIQIGTDTHFLVQGTKNIKISNCYSLVNQINLEDAVALISLAKCYIGIDSGMLHIAASLGIPRVSLWGPTSPEFRFSQSSLQTNIVSFLDCQGCHHRFPRLHYVYGCPYDIRCMREIKVGEVLSKCLDQLQTYGSSNSAGDS